MSIEFLDTRVIIFPQECFMKKLFILLGLLSFMGTSVLSAQSEIAPSESDETNPQENNTGWELNGGYGYLSLHSVAMIIADVIGSIFTAPAASLSDEETEYNYSDSGVFNLGLDYYFNDNLYAGITGTCQYFNAMETEILFTSFMLEGGVQYGWERFKFYHTLGAGLGLISTYKTNALFAFNLTLLGMKFQMADDFWLYLESNVGQKAFAQIGLRLKL